MWKGKLLALALAGVFAGSLHASEGDHGDEHEDGHGHEHAEEGGHADHFEGKPAKNLDQALTNFREANQQLEAILAKDELTSSDMNQVHKLSYTIENAMARLKKEMGSMAEDLEWVHKASERLDKETVRAKGANYLEAANKLAD